MIFRGASLGSAPVLIPNIYFSLQVQSDPDNPGPLSAINSKCLTCGVLIPHQNHINKNTFQTLSKPFSHTLGLFEKTSPSLPLVVNPHGDPSQLHLLRRRGRCAAHQVLLRRGFPPGRARTRGVRFFDEHAQRSCHAVEPRELHLTGLLLSASDTWVGEKQQQESETEDPTGRRRKQGT